MAEKQTESGGTPQAQSSIVMSFPQPPLRKAEDYLKAYTGYTYTAVSAIAQEVASIQLKLFRKKFVEGEVEATEVTEHESLSVLNFVNPFTTLYDLIEGTQIYLELVGEAFWIIVREGGEGTPQEIWMVRPDWMVVIPSETEIISGYVYKPGGDSQEKIFFPKENVIQLKYFNPTNPYRGRGSVQAAAMPIDVRTFAQEYNRNFFFNSATPGLVFTTDKKLSETAVKRFMNQWKAAHGGRAKSNKVAFLGGGFQMDKMSMGAQELDFNKQLGTMRDDVLAIFKVPKTVLGLTDDVNRANAEATTRAFMERVVTPRMRKLVERLNEFYLPMFGDPNLFFDFIDPAPEDVEKKLKVYENARKYGWLTPNEIRIEENREPLEGGDVLAPVSTLAAGASQAEPQEEGNGIRGLVSKLTGKARRNESGAVERKPLKKPFKHMMPIPPKRVEQIKRERFEKGLKDDISKLIKAMLKSNGEEKARMKPKVLKKDTLEKDPPKVISEIKEFESSYDKETKEDYWRQFVAETEEQEDQMQELVIALFEEEKHQVLDNLEGIKHVRIAKRKGLVDSLIPSIEDMNSRWLVGIVPFLKETLIERGRDVLEFIGVGGDLDITTDNAARFLREDSAEFVSAINETTRESLRKELAEGFAAGESIDQIRGRVDDVFTTATTSRTENIVRTEVLRANNFATVEAYKQSEVVIGKEWLTELDDRVCPWCEEMDGRIVPLGEDFFELGESLTVDGRTLDFDLLAVEHPPLHPQCRCTLIPVIATVTSLGLERGRVLLSEAQEEAGRVVIDAKRSASKMLAEMKEEAKKENKEVSEEVLEGAKEKATRIITEAEEKAREVIENANKEAEENKAGLVGEIKSLRDRAREVLGGRGKEKEDKSS